MELIITKPIIFLDLETTGINIANDRIIEISLLKIHPDGRQEIRTERINPTIPIPAVSTAIHGITDEDVKDCPTFAQQAPGYNQFIGNADLAGYNAIKFDFPLLVEEFLRVNIDFDLRTRKLVDVQNIFHKMEQRTLSAAYQFYCSKELVNAHSAEGDTIATYEIMKAQIDRYKDASFKDKNGKITQPIQNNISALSEFSYYNQNADLVGQIIFNQQNQEVFNFGKHKGKTVVEVFKIEPAYYDWMMKADFPLSTKKVITEIKLRGFNNSSVKIG
jgi:DNA polymerase-3 subunit epsilon